jgi:hypothetical protein
MAVHSDRQVAAAALAGAVGLFTLKATAQDAGSAWDGMRRVEPGRSDLGNLALESRLEPVELRLTQGFESLWRGGGSSGQTWFARRDGGITAVFERSDYAMTPGGMVPVIPAGTTFVIGEPNSILARRLGIGPMVGEAADASGGLRVSTRIETRVGTDPVGVDGANERGLRLPRPVSPDGRLGVARLLRLAASREKSGG